jgi:hypothetical protein
MLYALQEISLMIQGYFMPCVLLLGICGNLLSLVVFIRKRKRPDAPIQYLSCLAITDTVVIFGLGVNHWFNTGLAYITNGALSFSFGTYSSFTCKFGYFLLNVCHCMSAWLIIAFSLERAYVVWYPLKRSILTASKRSKYIVAMFSLSIPVSIHRLIFCDVFVFYSEGDGNITGCFYTVSPFATLMIWQYDELLHNYIPCLLIFAANVCILIGIRRANKSCDVKMAAARRQIQDGRILLSLMLISTLYVIFMMPASVSFSYQLYLFTTDNVSHIYLAFVGYLVTFCDEFSMMNFCFNFIVYGCTLPFYRNEVKSIFTTLCRLYKRPRP